jgi:hypothetical protein
MQIIMRRYFTLGSSFADSGLAIQVKFGDKSLWLPLRPCSRLPLSRRPPADRLRLSKTILRALGYQIRRQSQGGKKHNLAGGSSTGTRKSNGTYSGSHIQRPQGGCFLPADRGNSLGQKLSAVPLPLAPAWRTGTGLGGPISKRRDRETDCLANYLVSVICRTSFTRRSWVTTCLCPEGQSTSTRSIFCASPRPKYRGSELCDR